MIVTQSQLCLIIYLQLPQKYKQVQTIQRFGIICKLNFIGILPTTNLPMAIKKVHLAKTLTKLSYLPLFELNGTF